MKRIILLFALCLSMLMAGAQRITHTFNNATMPEALRYIQSQSKSYRISFIFNELEDFRVTTQLHRCSVSEAITQIIGFYPIRMTESDNHEIFVECINKTTNHFKGYVTDSNGNPIEFANIRLLSPTDSTFITGGVSNADGYFVIPCEANSAIAKISYVGYRTEYRRLSHSKPAHIQMQVDKKALKEVVVEKVRPFAKMERGVLTFNMTVLLQQLPADNAYEALGKIPGVHISTDGVSFGAQSVTLIINGKASTLDASQIEERLKQMPAGQLDKVEIMMSAPAKMHVRGTVINIVTKDYTGEHYTSGQVKNSYTQDKYGTEKVVGNLLHADDKLTIDANYGYAYGKTYAEVTHTAEHPLGDERVSYYDQTSNKSQGVTHNYRAGLDYQFSESHVLSLAYTGQWSSTLSHNTTTGKSQSSQFGKEHIYLHNVDFSYELPFHLQLAASYTHYENPQNQHLGGSILDTEKNLMAESDQKIDKWIVTADQSHSLQNKWQLSYGAKMQFTKHKSYQTTQTSHGETLPEATSSVDIKENIANGYLGFSKQFSPAFSMDASVTVENYHSPQWDEWRVYPALDATWNVNEQNMLNLSFDSDAKYPSYWSTMSNIYYSSIYSEIWGNPDLRPSKKYNFALMWMLNRKYTFTAFANLCHDFFVQLPYQTSDRMAVIMQEVNFDHRNSFGLQASAQFNIGSWLYGNAFVVGVYTNDKCSNFFDLPFNRSKLSAAAGGTVSALLSKKADIRLSIEPFFQNGMVQGVYDIHSIFTINVSLRWASANDKWNVTLAGNNLTNYYFNTRSVYGNQNFGMKVNQNWIDASLSISYKFGNYKQKKTKEVDTSRMGH